MKEKTLLHKILPYLLVLPSMLLLVVVVLFPIISNIGRSFQLEEGGMGLDNYIYFFTDPIQVNNILYTLKIVVITVVVCIVVAYLLAMYLRFSNSMVSKLIGNLYLLPRFIPGLVAVNGMITIIRDSGLINRIGQLFGLNIQLGLMYNEKGVIMMNLWFNIPFATMLLASAMSSIPDSIIEAAQAAGANHIKLFLTLLLPSLSINMFLPLTYQDVFLAITFIFMSNIGSFTTPYLMDGNNPQMLGIALYSLFNNFPYERAAALSVIIFLFSAVSAVVYIHTNMKEQEWEKK